MRPSREASPPAPAPVPWHARPAREVAERLASSLAGLGPHEAAERLLRHGPNRLPPPRATSRWRILLRQFASPLIYVLLAAAGIALLLGEGSDAGFIAAVLAINAVIGFANEARAEREVRALAKLVRTRARVQRGGRVLDVDAEDLVPGDLVLLESGGRVAADLRLVEEHALRIDESLLTGEALPADKDASLLLPEGAVLADRRNMAFTGTLVASGRALGLVVATGPRTEVGAIAGVLSELRPEPPPLVRRMERFARAIGAAVLVLAAVLIGIGLLRGQPLGELMLGAVALAVSAIPEGLPVAMTVALAVAVSRMARRRVVVRHLPAVEGLGSCGVVATDKTGTLTRNELTVEQAIAGDERFVFTGGGYEPEGEILRDGRRVVLAEELRLFRLLRAACLANEASLARRGEGDGAWEWSGDPTDVALLCAGIKGGCDPVALREAHPLLDALPFEPERRYAASFHASAEGMLVCVKGAPERVLEMCATELDASGRTRVPLDRTRARERIEAQMREGHRVLAIAEAEVPGALAPGGTPSEPRDLVLLGLVAMTDPPRPDVLEALATCRRAGVHVLMLTGDHATTASAIAARIGLAEPGAPVLTGAEIVELDDEGLARRLDGCAVVARATPADKLRVVQAWQGRGELVAVTGDGVNDAPALRQADLGVAMGRAGTDVAREASDLVITDDDFSSLVAGIEEGRVVYDNVRKVIYLLVSTGAGEVVLVTLALALGLPLPLTAVQLLWLNLVTNGIQHVGLALERREPDVMLRRPRSPRERIFDRIMLERTFLAGAVLGLVGLYGWYVWLGAGRGVDESRNLMMQLFVLFEIFHIGNSRSERISLFRLSPLRNPWLLVATLSALTVHVFAMYTPFFQRLLGIAPLAPREWLVLALMAATVVVAMEAHKLWRRLRPLAA